MLRAVNGGGRPFGGGAVYFTALCELYSLNPFGG